MNKHTIVGTIKESAGTLEQGIGKLTGDRETELRGHGHRVEGRVQNVFGRTIDEARRFYEKNPRLVLIAAGSLVLSAMSALVRGGRS